MPSLSYDIVTLVRLIGKSEVKRKTPLKSICTLRCLVSSKMSNTSNVTLEFLYKFSPSIIKNTPIEVLTFGPLDYKLSVLTGSIIAFISFLSLAGNFLMMMLYITYRTLRTGSNKLVMTLTCSNILMHIKSWIIVVNGLAGGPVLGRFGRELM